jgi:hypothetical protein
MGADVGVLRSPPSCRSLEYTPKGHKSQDE